MEAKKRIESNYGPGLITIGVGLVVLLLGALCQSFTQHLHLPYGAYASVGQGGTLGEACTYVGLAIVALGGIIAGTAE